MKKCSQLQACNKNWSSNAQRGFSLIELLVVMGLLTIIISLVFSTTTFLNRTLVRTEIEKLYMTCRYLQQKARATNASQTLTFDTDRNSYRYGDHEERLHPSVTFGVLPGTKGPPSHPQRVLNKSITFGKKQIQFHPDGIIKPGTVYLIDTTRTFFYALSSPISQISYLRKYAYSGKWQRL